MIRSMTGYGKADAVIGGRRIVIEVKSLNHRYQEMALRMPGFLFSLEPAVKKLIAARISRGRVEVVIRIESDGSLQNGSKLKLNLPLIQNYYQILKQIKEEFSLTEDISLATLTAFRDAFVAAEEEENLAGIWEMLVPVLDEAMVTLTAMREKEGVALRQDLMDRLAIIKTCLGNIALRAPQVVVDYRKRLSERVKEFSEGIDVDEIRLAQEVAMFAEKSDITEEIVRLESHIKQFHDVMDIQETIGRKVDFLIQEMNREVNTIGSKSGDSEISRQVIDIKSELSKLREQVQNIE
ncbi:MAG: YicC/YloC family endoribonuclease [Syntrophales bacterium]